MKRHTTAYVGNLRVAISLLALIAVASTNLLRGAEIHDAIRNGNLEKVKVLLQQNPSLISAEDDKSDTPLFYAVWFGHKDIAEFLLAKKANVNFKDQNGVTALHVAASTGNKELVELLLTNGADINSEMPNGYTPLRLAIEFKRADVAQFLLSKGAEERVSDKNTASSAGGDKSHNHPIAMSSAPVNGATDAAETYEELRQNDIPVTFRAATKYMEFAANGKPAGIDATVVEFAVFNTDVELVSDKIVLEGENAVINTRNYGKVRVMFASDASAAIWVTPGQKAEFLKLAKPSAGERRQTSKGNVANSHPTLTKAGQNDLMEAAGKGDLSQVQSIPAAPSTAPTKATIQAAQKRLIAMGYQPGSADGVLGPKAIASLKKFQSDQNFPMTGELDRKTLDALNAPSKGTAISQQDVKKSATQAAPPQSVEKSKNPLSEMSALEVAHNPAKYGFKKTATMNDGVMSGNDAYNGDLSMVIGRNEQWQLKKDDGTVLVLTVHWENGRPASARWGGF